MGHPGAQNHDHHRSVWFAHHNIGGVNFWSDQTDGKVRQKHWYSYRDGDDEAIMASCLGWYDGSGKQLMEQDVVAAIIPMKSGEHALEIQITMRPPAKVKSVELGKTNFGFLAVRVAKSVSVHFGGGKLTNSDNLKGEKAIFGKQAKWMDYSGSVAVGKGADRKAVIEGITYFDHPTNPRHPTWWHARDYGLITANPFGVGHFERKKRGAGDMKIKAGESVTFRYRFLFHEGDVKEARIERRYKAWGEK